MTFGRWPGLASRCNLGLVARGMFVFFFWNFLSSAQKLLRAIPYFINERVMLTNYIGRYDQSTWGKKEHIWNEWICNCLAIARFCLTRKNDNVCGRAILSVDAIGIAFNWLKVRCWLLGGGAGLEGVERSFPQMFAEMYRPFVKLYIIFWISCTEYRTQFFFL